MKRCFLTGLVTLLPLAITIWVFKLMVNFLTSPFMGLMTDLLKKMPEVWLITNSRALRTLSELLILIGLFIFTFFLGLVARRFFFDRILRFGDRILERIPLVNKVYKTTKEIVQSLFSSNKPAFKQVVLLPFPYKGSFCIGLISKESPSTCTDPIQKLMVSVYIPTTPNPTTGFLVMVPEEELIYLDMKSEDAMKYVISCAVIQPSKKEVLGK